MKSRFARLCGAAFLAALVCLFAVTPPLWQADCPQGDGKPFFENTPDLIDLNTAPAAELACLPGIGAKRAEAIIAYRTENGGFSSVEELSSIQGISMRIVEDLRALVLIS